MSRSDTNKKEPTRGIKGVGLVDKQTGGNEQYARVEVTVRPVDNPDTIATGAADAQNTIINGVVGGAIPVEFLSSVTEGIREALQQGPLGGYPVTGVSVTITVIGDVNRRRGQVLDTKGGSSDSGYQTIEARVPLSEMFGYATHLRSMTQGRASFVLEPNGYAEAPAWITQAVIDPRGNSAG